MLAIQLARGCKKSVICVQICTKMKILIPTDFSENAWEALRYASKLLAVTGGKLLLVSAYDVPSVSRGSTSKLRKHIEGDMEANANRWRSEIAYLPEVPDFEIYMREEGTLDLILRAIEHFEADLVVMGTKGSSGLEEVVIGSVAAAVIEHAPIPVLAVPAGAEFNGFEKVTFACDLSEDSLESGIRLHEWMKPFEGQLEVLHVCKSDAEKAQMRLRKLQDDLNAAGFQDVAGDVRVNDDIREGIIEYLEEAKPVLLAMVTRKRSLLGKLFDSSLTKKVAMHLQLPLLAIHA